MPTYPNSVIKVLQALSSPESFLVQTNQQRSVTNRAPVEVASGEELALLAVHSMMLACGFRLFSWAEASLSQELTLQLPQPENLTFAQLPVNWKQQPWSIAYKHSQSAQTFLIKCVPFGKQFVILAGTEETKEVHVSKFVLAETISLGQLPCNITTIPLASLFGLFPKLRDLFHSFHKDIVKKLMPEIADIREDPPASSERIRREEPRRPPDHIYPEPLGPPPLGSRPYLGPTNPFSVGDRDLDPLAPLRPPSAGGGMYVDPDHPMFARPNIRPPFNPLGPQILPPGAVPPGARFDPITPFGPMSGPPGSLPRPPPSGRHFSGDPVVDPDELPPPGYSNMYM